MRTTVMFGAGDVQVLDRPDVTVDRPTDAVVRVVRAGICGTDLHPYRDMAPQVEGVAMGHEVVGVVEDVGADVAGVARGDLVVSPFAFSDGTCEFCRGGLHTACVHGGFLAGGQAEAVRVPQADGTLVRVPASPADLDDPIVASLLTLADVYLTGVHGATTGGVGPGSTVVVIGDGAVGLCAVLASVRLGAGRVVLMGRHQGRTDLGCSFGATDVVAARGAEGAEEVLELTGGRGAHVVIEAVGTRSAYDQAVAVVRPGGSISRVGVPQYEEAPIGGGSLFPKNVMLTGGPAPVRAYLDDAMSDVLAGRIEPGRVLDSRIGLEQTPDGYRAMASRRALKVAIAP